MISSMPLPKLHPKAAYLTINNAAKRNALSLAILQDLKTQLLKHNTSPSDRRQRFLPPFNSSLLNKLERISLSLRSDGNSDDDLPSSIYGTTFAPHATPTADIHRTRNDRDLQASYSLKQDNDETDLKWLLSTTEFNRHRANLPRALILRTEGPIFSSGHDLRELSRLPHDEVKQTFQLCAQVMSLIRRSPIPIISVIAPGQLATAAGAQLALTTDFTVAHASARLQLPGQAIGIPCSSPSSAVSRRLNAAATYRMLALAEPARMDELFGTEKGDAVEVVHAQHNSTTPNDQQTQEDEDQLNARVDQIISKIVDQSAALPQALGKWAFWTQLGLDGTNGSQPATKTEREGANGGDGYEDAVSWTGRMMAVHARCDDAGEGISAFFEKRPAKWKT